MAFMFRDLLATIPRPPVSRDVDDYLFTDAAIGRYLGIPTADVPAELAKRGAPRHRGFFEMGFVSKTELGGPHGERS